jgi:hypothetical protein
VRFRDIKPEDLARARAEVAAWRTSCPQGTPAQLVEAVGATFPARDWGVVLRGILFAVDRHQARNITGVINGPAEAAP